MDCAIVQVLCVSTHIGKKPSKTGTRIFILNRLSIKAELVNEGLLCKGTESLHTA